MAIEIAKYQFHSWSRKGVSGEIAESDDLGSGASTQLERAEVPIDVTLNGNPKSKNFLLIGPGDILGINSNMIVRTEPLNWITNFEPNYLAFVEFYDEDFAWRYTPAAAKDEKLRPWLLLLVLKQDEFERGKNTVPLPSIKIKSKSVFPPVTESWLWAHMHSNANLPESDLTDYEKFLLSLNKTRNDDPDQLFSRLVCPRRLDVNTAYNVFLVPAFETGRQVGLQPDADLSNVNAQAASWDNNGAKGDMPVYFEWYFHTGLNEDFESLVNLLEPRPVDPSVGIRDMDCSEPGFVQADHPDLEIPGTMPPILGLEGALKSPDAKSTVFPDPPNQNDFQVELEKIANLAVTITGNNSSEDPVVSAPIYGSNHARKSANDQIVLDITKNNWVNALNKDPRDRVPSGFGTTVMQGQQEYFMRKAWAQVTGVLAANKIIKATVIMMNVSVGRYLKSFAKVPGELLVSMSRPLLPKIMGSPTTLYQQVKESPTPSVVFSGAMRRLTRPRGRFLKKLSPANALLLSTIISGINAGKITTAPANNLPQGLPNTKTIADQIANPNLPAWLKWLAAHRLLALIIALVLILLFGLLTSSWVITGVLAAATVAGYISLNKINQNADAATQLSNPQAALDGLSQIPPKPNFTYIIPGETSAPPPTTTSPEADSVEAANFRSALADIDKRMAFTVPAKAIVPFDLANAASKIGTAIDPKVAFTNKLFKTVRFPGYIPASKAEDIFPAMAYPDFEDPMYKYLCDISQELLMPNIKLIPPNTITLVQTNPPFIESYMVGLNHEMGRELLWREYPTDQRGSYFRQFWDVKGIIAPSTNQTQAQLTEMHKDITKLDTWATNSLLGSHNNRGTSGSTSPQAVMIIRGELLKRYPNTLIFAQKAIAGSSEDEPIIDTSLDDTTFATEVKFPLYKADASPDIKFFGFDLTIGQARGTEPSPGFNDNLGWFFVIQEVPGEPRFGMDISVDPNATTRTWENVAWTDFADPNMSGITAATQPTTVFPEANRWGSDAANMAYILFRRPAMVAVHASELLSNLTT